jgi:hypothetical protein
MDQTCLFAFKRTAQLVMTALSLATHLLLKFRLQMHRHGRSAVSKLVRLSAPFTLELD